MIGCHWPSIVYVLVKFQNNYFKTVKMGAKTQLGVLIQKLKSEGKSYSKIAETLGIAKSSVFKYLKRFRQTGTFEDRPKTGRPRSVRSRDLVEKVRKCVKRNPNRSATQLAKTYGCGSSTMKRVLKCNLDMKPFKYVRRQLLNSAQVQKRLVRGRKIKKLLSGAPRPTVIWTDEKIFTVQRVWNRQNDRIWAVNLEDIPIGDRTQFCRQHPAHIMVWGGVTCDGRKTPLIVIPEGVKINSDTYIDMLDTKVAPWIEGEVWEDGYTFQQDGAPSHTSNRTQAWLKANFMDFWPKDLWPPSSPDLNPMDYSV